MFSVQALKVCWYQLVFLKVKLARKKKKKEKNEKMKKKERENIREKKKNYKREAVYFSPFPPNCWPGEFVWDLLRWSIGASEQLMCM